jgi:ketosteroid isomerase-like protein
MIDTLWAERAIRRCLNEYCRGMDERDEALVISTYHTDAIDRHPPYEGPGIEYPAVAFAGMAGLMMSSHQITNCYIEVDGDGADVTSHFLVALHKDAVAGSGYEVATIAGRMIDRFECRAGCWKVADRSVHVDVDTVVPHVPLYPPTLHTHRFVRART